MGRDYEWELMPLGSDQKVGAVVWSPLGWGRLTGKIRRVAAARGESFARSTVVVDAAPVADACCSGSWMPRRGGKESTREACRRSHQLALATAYGLDLSWGHAMRSSCGRTWWGECHTPAQVTKLDAASARRPYPYWHQISSFAERNAPPT